MRAATAERRTTASVTLTLASPLPWNMADRIMKVNAYTTLDLLDGEAEGHGFTEEARELAADLEKHAGEVEAAAEED